MSRNSSIRALVLSCSVLVATASIDAAPAPKSAKPPASQPTIVDPAEIQDKVLPALNMDSVSLRDFLDYVGDLIPGFQFVIVRDPGVPAEYPTLPAMKLKKVTLGQVLSIIQEAFPGLDVHPVESEKGAAIYVFKIQTAVGAGLGLTPQTELKIYRLAEAVEMVYHRHTPPVPPELTVSPQNIIGGGGGGGRLNGESPEEAKERQVAEKKAREAYDKVQETYDQAVKAVRKEALDSVLSLLKAALAQAGDTGVAPVIQVHEETQTLLLRGTASQIAAVQSALEALTPDAVVAPIKEKFAQTEHRYEAELAKNADESARRSAELAAARAEVDSLHQDLLKLEVSQEKLKLQLEEARKKVAPKE